MSGFRSWMSGCAALLLLMSAPALASTSEGLLYRLEAGSALTRGCFDPCLCPIMTTETLRGTFELVPTEQDPLFMWYEVREVNLLVEWAGKTARLTGAGTYRVGGEVAVVHELKLMLELDVNGIVETLVMSSGLVPGGNSFEITASVNGMYCFDTVLDLVAEPVPEDEVQRYVMDAGQFVQTCFDPCDCIVHNKWPLVGAFDVVPIGGTTAATDYAVVNVLWKALATELPGYRFRGFGVYRIATFTDQHRLMLTIEVTPETEPSPREFDSGWRVAGSPFPRIEIAAAEHGFYCLDHVLEVGASPDE